MDKIIYYKIKIGINLIDLNQIFPIKTSEFEISVSVESYDKENY